MYRGRMDQPPETQTIPSWTLDVDSGILTAALCPRSGGREAILREIAGVFGGANDQHLGLLLASAASYVLDPTVDAKSAVRTAARFLAVSLSGRERSDLVDSTDGFCRALTAALCANMWSLTVHDMAPPDVFAIAHEPWMTQRGVDPDTSSDGDITFVHLAMDGPMALSVLRSFEALGASCVLTPVGVDRFGTRI